MGEGISSPSKQPRRPAALQHVGMVGVHGMPIADRPVRPSHTHLSLNRRAEAKMPPAKLTAGVTAADRDFPPLFSFARAKFEPGADRVAIRPGLARLELDPVAGIDAHIAPEL